MKKFKTLKITFESWDSFTKRTEKALVNAVEHGIKSIQPKDVLIFSSPLVYQQRMSEQKYIILAAIKNLKPTSVYHLAKMVDRDFANVMKDCVTLAATGFIVLKDAKDNRKTKIPQLSFDYDAIEIQLPKMTYSHSLGKLAA